MVIERWNLGRDDGEYNGVGFMKISKIIAMRDAYFVGTISFDRLYLQGTVH